MAKRSKLLATGAAILAVTAAGAVTYAQMGHGNRHMGHMGGQGMSHGGMMGHQGVSAVQLDALKNDLAIRPEQTEAWDAYAKLVAETAAERRQVHENIDRDAVHKMQPNERQAFRDSMMKQREAEAGRIRTAAETLLAQLDEQQKSKAHRLLPGLASSGHGGGHAMRHGGGHSGGHH